MLELCVMLLLVPLIKSQSSCQWYNWSQVTGENDWPDGTTQNFSALIGNAYFDSNDFNASIGGRFAGSTWKTIFYKNVNYWRPLGYKYARLGAQNNPTVCITVNGTQGYKVELMVYTLTTQANICAADLSSDKFDVQDSSNLDACATQYLYKCFVADTTSNQLLVALYCKSGCLDISSTDLLFRFRRSTSQYALNANTTNQNPEMWCMTIAANIDYPDSITSSTPSNYVNQNDNLFSSAFELSIKLSLFIIIFLWIIS